MQQNEDRDDFHDAPKGDTYNLGQKVSRKRKNNFTDEQRTHHLYPWIQPSSLQPLAVQH
jgi:hypothetical protein